MNKACLPFLSFALAALLALPLLSGCAQPNEDTMIVEDSITEPPQPQYETAPLISDPQNQIWIPGYWGMSNHQYVWVPGKIVARPAPTAVWKSALWVHHMYGWSFEQGHWE